MYIELARNFILVGMAQINLSLALTSEVACFPSPREGDLKKVVHCLKLYRWVDYSTELRGLLAVYWCWFQKGTKSYLLLYWISIIFSTSSYREINVNDRMWWQALITIWKSMTCSLCTVGTFCDTKWLSTELVCQS